MPTLWTVKTIHHFPLVRSFWEQLYFWHSASPQFMFACTLYSTNFIGTIIFWYIEKTVTIRVVLFLVNNIISKNLNVLEIINKEERPHFLMKYGCTNSPDLISGTLKHDTVQKFSLGLNFVEFMFCLRQMAWNRWEKSSEEQRERRSVVRMEYTEQLGKKKARSALKEWMLCIKPHFCCGFHLGVSTFPLGCPLNTVQKVGGYMEPDLMSSAVPCMLLAKQKVSTSGSSAFTGGTEAIWLTEPKDSPQQEPVYCGLIVLGQFSL